MAVFNFATELALSALLFYVKATLLTEQNQQARQCTSGTFSSVITTTGVYVTVERAVSVPENGNYGEGSLDMGFPDVTSNLPKLCAVIISVTNTSAIPQSNYRFGLFLPDTWNSKILTVGSASFAGGINWPAMSEGVHYKMVTLSTDNGHNSIPSDLSWATPSTLLDWGYRALHGSVEVGKLMTKAYYGQDSTRLYYSGCSTGGRQGLKEIQISPSSFDGALIGAPAWDTKYLMPWITKIGVDVLNGTGTFGKSEMTFLATKILALCDAKDGHKDNIVSWPEQCNPDLNTLLCGETGPPPNPTTCLTAGQIETAKKIYSDYSTSNGTFVHNGFEISSEAQWPTYLTNNAPTSFDVDYERYFLYNDTNWNWKQFNDNVSYNSMVIDPGKATADSFDVSTFQKRGGKILMYHGMADGFVPTKSSLLYYTNTAAAMPGVNLQSFFRYYQVPGMQHCFGSDSSVNAPWMFAGGSQAYALQTLGFGPGWSVPGFLNNSKYDALVALMDWVENDTAVDQIIATAWSLTSTEVTRQRPICPYPKKATYNGNGDENNATNWHCA
jgi:feruloyl esterase